MRLQRCCICAQLSDGGGELHCQQRRTTADRPTDPIDDDDRSTDHHAEKSMSPPPLPSDDDEGRKWARNKIGPTMYRERNGDSPILQPVARGECRAVEEEEEHRIGSSFRIVPEL
ncbi:hypothetical protein RB195_001467 [Necator americanus]|uniref:Uncharacterized protein n=1 Tax=Necator americanus TaxID=51031 RepID=A0ABR1DFV1_NECAM